MSDLPRPVVAIGNFDGVHKGHRAVIGRAQQLAAELGRPAAVLTFEPHPRTFFRPEEPVFRLTPEPVQATILARMGVDGMIVVPFDAELAGLSADAFFDDLLVGTLGVSGLVVGHNFHFGRGRAGSPGFLRQRGEAAGLPVVIVEPVSEGGEAVSSSLVRVALETGDIETANRLLGYRWFVQAQVRHGDKRGRTLGYPTANLRLGDDCRLAHGIYAVRVCIDGEPRAAVASFGRRPTFDNGAPLLEVHVFDFSGSLYDRYINVEFLAWLRGEERFASIDDLVAQMDRDSAAARAIIAADPAPMSMLGA